MKFKSLAFLTAFALIVPYYGFSQVGDKLKLGLKVAPNIAWMSPGTKGYSNDGARIGATIGFVSDFYFADNYALSTGFNFQFLNGALKYEDSISVVPDGKLQNGEVSRKFNFMYLEIPLMVKMQTKKFKNISYFGQIGVGTGFRIKATVKDHVVFPDGTTMENNEDFSYGTTLMRESVLFGIGCTYHIDESSRVLIGINYSNALNNVLKGINSKSGLDIKSPLNFAEISIGFLF